MPQPRLGKKLQPAKKAWKSFSNTVKSRVHKLNIPKAIKTTLQRLLSTLHSFRHLIPHRGRRSLTKRSRTRSYAYHAASSYYHVPCKNFSAICIDDLFPEPASSCYASSSSSTFVHANKVTHAQGETSRGRGKEDVGGGSSTSGINTIEDAWKVVVAKSPQLQVDKRAEEFISKFHQDMKLQKERSLLEYQETLARSA